MMFIAVGIVGIPTGIMATGFQDELEKIAKKEVNLLENNTSNSDIDNDDDDNQSNISNNSNYNTFDNNYSALSDDEMNDFISNEFRYKVYQFLHHPEQYGISAIIFKNFIFGLIIANTIAWFVASEKYHIGQGIKAFDIWTGGLLETITILIFTIEYMLRVWSIIEEENISLHYNSAILGRLNYMISFLGLVDLLSILPWYFDQFF